MNEQEFVYNKCPLLDCSLFKKLTFKWIDALLVLGRKKQLQLSDLYSPVHEDEASILTQELEK